jgi:hypothetical protein
VTLNVEVSHDRPERVLTDTVGKWLKDNAEPTGDRKEVPYRILAASFNPHPDTMSTVVVTPEGVKEAVAQPGQPTNPNVPGFNSGGGASGGTAPPSRGRMEGGGGAGSGGAGGLRGPPTGGQVAAPGGDLGDSGKGSGGSLGSTPAAPSTPSQPTQPMAPIGVGTAADPNVVKDLNAMAPAPRKPRLYPDGSKYFLVPITFEVELIDPKAIATPAAPAGDAAARAEDSEAKGAA